MHFSLADVVVGAIVLLAWSVLILYSWRRARRRRRRRESWEALMLSYPALDRELDEIWRRR
jgi:hypothetical protein